jgi:hypothetical protein
VPNRTLYCFAVAGIAACLGFAQSPNQLVSLRHWTGEGVSPVYEGYDVNPDGSFNMWFGYMNRNYEEEPDIPIGPDNTFDPGGDRGQPTHFSIRRNKDIFAVVVPKDFGDKKVIWTITVHGKTEKVSGSLDRVWMIDRKFTTRGGNIESVASNTPPVAKVAESALTVTYPGVATLGVSATDDGLPARGGKPIGMTVRWAKYRGPGAVVFSPAQAKIIDGKAAATASFSQPGDYLLQAVVDDGSGEVAGNFGYHCCWTNVQLKVTVRSK